MAEYQAVIDWGDGTTSLGTITGSGAGPYTVTGHHVYTDVPPVRDCPAVQRIRDHSRR